MQRRRLCQAIAMGLVTAPILNAGLTQQAQGALSDTRITRIRLWNPTGTNGLSDWINLSEILVTIETDSQVSPASARAAPRTCWKILPAC